MVKDGELLLCSMEFSCHPESFRDSYLKALDNDKKKLEALVSALPDFKSKYQAWYSVAQAVIKQVLPDRLADFTSYFDVPKGRKDITFQNYMIRDYLQGLQVTRGWEKEVVVGAYAAIPEFRQQLNIVKAAREKLESTLLNLTAILQADLFDSEIETAEALAKSGFLRAAGAICGVVIEKHLQQVCSSHNLTIRKKNPTISELSQILKDASIIETSQWRYIQHLADLRNLCDHAKGREPSKDEILDLTSGTQKVLKTVF